MRCSGKLESLAGLEYPDLCLVRHMRQSAREHRTYDDTLGGQFVELLLAFEVDK